MEKRSKHYGDVQKWIEKVIDSCETYQQTFVVKRLIVNFQKQMRVNEVDPYFTLSVISILEIRLKTKRQSFLNKE